MTKHDSHNHFPCPICQIISNETIFASSSYFIVYCNHCDFGFLVPQPKPTTISSIYSQNYFSDKNDTGYLHDAEKKLSFIKTHIESNHHSLLDIGCGLGHFLQVAKTTFPQRSGFDISAHAAKFVSHSLKIPVKFGFLNTRTYSPNSFDVITLFDVIEHIPQFQTTLADIHLWLKSKQLLFLTTPNLKSWDAKILGKKWYGYTKIPQHLNYFTPQSITQVLDTAGFNSVSIKTWGFSRNLDFYLSKLPFLYSKLNQSRIQSYLKQTTLYLPMVDMMVLAQKK